MCRPNIHRKQVGYFFPNIFQKIIVPCLWRTKHGMQHCQIKRIFWTWVVPVNMHTAAASPGLCENRGINQHNDTQSVRNCTSIMSARAVPLNQVIGPTDDSSYSSFVGQDLWRQLKRVQIPVFSADKSKYKSWKAASFACIDSASATETGIILWRQHR